MPSLLHEGLPQLVRDHPELTATLLTDLLGVALPPFSQVRLDEAALPQLVPVEHFADAVALFYGPDPSVPVFGTILENQLQIDPRKLYTWPCYATLGRARHECPFVVIVVTPDPKVAQWAAQPIFLGPDLPYRVLVIGPAGVPIITDPERALRDPYLAMLSVMAHGQGDPDTALAIAQVTTAAIRTLPKFDQRLLYSFILLSSLGDAARKAFEMLPNIEPYLNDTQRRAFAEAEAKGKAEGRAEGEAEGKARAEAEGILKILAKRGISMTDVDRQRILACRDLSTLDGWFDRAISATTIDELFE